MNPHVDFEEIARRYIDGAEYRELSEEYDLHWSTIWKHLRRLLAPEFREVVAVQHSILRSKCPRRSGGPRRNAYQCGQLRGAAARRWVPIGTVKMRYRTTKFGDRKPWYWVVKVADESYGSEKNWQALAAYRWEERHGKLPDDWFVVHQDGNRLNDHLGNLAAVPHSQLIRHARRIKPRAFSGPAVSRRNRKMMLAFHRVKRGTGLVRAARQAVCAVPDERWDDEEAA